MTTVQRSGRSSGPWQVADLLVVYVTSVVGIGLVALGWLGASSSVALSSQVAWTTAAALGLVISGTGNLLWVFAGRRRVGMRARSLLDWPARLTSAHVSVDEVDVVHHQPTASTEAIDRQRHHLVAPRGAAFYHEPDCILVEGKAAHAATRQGHENAGRGPCGMCEPQRTPVQRMRAASPQVGGASQ